MLPSGAFLSVWGELSAPPFFHAPPLRGVARRKEQGNHPPRGGEQDRIKQALQRTPCGGTLQSLFNVGLRAPHPRQGAYPLHPTAQPRGARWSSASIPPSRRVAAIARAV